MTNNPFSNKTEYAIKNDSLRYTWTAYNIFIFLSSLVGDSIILVASIKYRAIKLHKFIVATLQHIAVCDLLAAVVTVLPRVVTLVANDWILGDDLIYVSSYGFYYFGAVGLLLISVMTSGKLFIVKSPFRARLLTKRRGQLVCTGMWLLGSAILVLLLIIQKDAVYFDFRTYDCRFKLSSISWKWLKSALVILFTVIPNILVVVTTVFLLVIARGIAQRGGDNLRWQGVISTILVAVVYCMSILPWTIFNFMAVSEADFVKNPHGFFRTDFHRIVKSFTCINIISNFYIYTITVRSFREFLRSSRLNIFRNCVSDNENSPCLPVSILSSKPVSQ